jgi:hypothetical protein
MCPLSRSYIPFVLNELRESSACISRIRPVRSVQPWPSHSPGASSPSRTRKVDPTSSLESSPTHAESLKASNPFKTLRLSTSLRRSGREKYMSASSMPTIRTIRRYCCDTRSISRPPTTQNGSRGLPPTSNTQGVPRRCGSSGEDISESISGFVERLSATRSVPLCTPANAYRSI